MENIIICDHVKLTQTHELDGPYVIIQSHSCVYVYVSIRIDHMSYARIRCMRSYEVHINWIVYMYVPYMLTNFIYDHM